MNPHIEFLWAEQAKQISRCMGHQGKYEKSYVAHVAREGNDTIIAAFTNRFSMMVRFAKGKTVFATLDIDNGTKTELAVEKNGGVRKIISDFTPSGDFIGNPREETLTPQERRKIKRRVRRVAARSQELAGLSF